MVTPVATGPYSLEDLDRFPDDGRLRELVGGQIVEWDVTNFLHGALAALLTTLLSIHVRPNKLGRVVGGDSLVRIQGSVHGARGPDVAFYRRDRIPKDKRAAATDAVPDMVIEILSPSDRAAMVDAKIEDWLGAGVRLLWYINPENGVTTVYHAGGIHRVAAEEVLDGADVLPGWHVRLRDLLDEIEAEDDAALTAKEEEAQ